VTGSAHLDRLAARGRPTGGVAIEEARAYCGDVLAALGFTVTRRTFEFSTFPGHFGTPLVGGFVALVVSFGAWTDSRAGGRAALILLAMGYGIAGAIGRYLTRRGVLSFPLMRRRGVNLEAVRGPGTPAVWLVAHVDSKGQPIPTAVRTAGIVLLALASIAALVVSILRWRTAAAFGAWHFVLVGTWLGAIPVVLSIIADRGTGAVDNASGVASVLAAAEQLPHTANVGVLITDAEEFGLAGARAWVVGRAAGIALNCDGVDDMGRMTMMYSGRAPRRLARALGAAASASGEMLRVMRVVPGVLTDSVALAAAGWETATLSRGSLRTLARVHSASDTLTTLRGTGIATAATILARASNEMS
jgi:hypothetical protein